MKKINVLDKKTAQLIAAGEVVERPASALKELVENSVDAGAKRISVEIKNGGVKLLKVCDNGSGIYREDVKNAFLRHATSKLLGAEDLSCVNSLGFRGEALASVCAVSKTEIITKSSEENFGTRLFINGGIQGSTEDFGCSNGTQIAVRDLFYNTPARMKFLKKDVSEANACASVIDKLALSHPEISFKFTREGKNVLNTPGDGKISSAVYSVYGKTFFEGMIPLDYNFEGIKVSGFISRPLCAKSSRSMQNFFVNGRYVKSGAMCAALEEAFKNSVMVGKFPYCVMYIEISPNLIDVNVHPAKTEVKFINEKNVFEAIYYGVKSSLMANDKAAISFAEPAALPPTALNDSAFSNAFSKPASPQTYFKNSVQISDSVFAPKKQNLLFEKEKNDDFKINFNKPQNLSSTDDLSPKANLKNELENFKTFENTNFFEESELKTAEICKPGAKSKINAPLKIVGEIFRCYIMVERGEEVILIDKHAAHERIIFEKLKKSGAEIQAQSLLEPITVTLEKEEYGAILENSEMLSKAGYATEDFGSGSVIVRSIPMYLDIFETADSISEIASYILKNKKSINTKKLDWLYHNIACRAAIKAGAKNSNEEIQELIKNLLENPEIKYCPHGRPVFVSVTKKSIEKKFGRL